MASEITPSAPPYSQYEFSGAIIALSLEVEAEPLSSDLPSWTDAKIKRVAFYVFAAVCVVGGASLIGLSVTGAIPSPFGYLAIPLFLLAITSVCVASQILDYEDPVELQAMKDEAPYLSYQQLTYKHGLENISRYDILLLSSLREKFFRYANTFLSFRSFNREVDIIELWYYDILIDESDYRLLKDLEMRLNDENLNLRQIALDLDKKYEHRVNRRLKALEYEEEKARKRCNSRIENCRSQCDQGIEKKEIKTCREAQKTATVARVTADAQWILNQTLATLQSERERVSKDPLAIEQQRGYDQELAAVQSENKTNAASIELAFSEWLKKSR